MTINADDVDVSVDLDVRRRAGWLPENHDTLESWLHSHRKRAEVKAEQSERSSDSVSARYVVSAALRTVATTTITTMLRRHAK